MHSLYSPNKLSSFNCVIVSWQISLAILLLINSTSLLIVIFCFPFLLFALDGLDALDELEKIPVNEKTYRPEYDIKIKNITIHANPIAENA